MADLIRRKKLSARETLDALLKQIERVNPQVNAIVTLVAEQAREKARRADEAQARGAALGPLHGLPIAHKDLVETAGIRTTFGSRIFKDYVPAHDAILVERIRSAGAICLGKTNAPEFGAGSQTFNAVFGATKNPFDLTKTCGGSSGGAAVSLACGMIPIADGSDSGGSLRNPAAFCDVVGFRNAPGRVAHAASGNAWSTIAVSGPKSGTLRAMGPETAMVDHAFPLAAWATRPGAVRNPTTSQNAAGLRNEPPLSLPSAIGIIPHARLTAAPPLLPPQVFVKSKGFFVAPNTALKVCDPAPNSGALVLPRQIAPALLIRSTRIASCAGT